MGDLVLVSGLGRCGSSLLMQMLSVGGFPIFNHWDYPYPSFEHHGGLTAHYDIPEEADGAIKWLDPHHFEPPRFAARSIWLSRDHREQAKSQIKLLRACGHDAGRSYLPQFVRSFREEEPLARKVLSGVGPLLAVDFSELIARPRTALASIAKFLGAEIDIVRASKSVRSRPTGADCLPYFLEQTLIEEAESV